MRSFKVLVMLLIIGALVGKMYAQGTITIVTEKVVGQTITLLISTEQGTAPVVKGATTNIFKNGNFTDYTLTEQTVTFTGDITIFGCGAEQITSVQLSKTDKLKVLGCNKNKISSLTLTEAPNLEQLSCSANQLEILDLSKMPKLKKIYLHSNKIRGSNMTDLVNSVPQNNTGLMYELFIVNKTNTAEQNIATKNDVDILKNKNWTVYDYNGGNPILYNGENTSGIEHTQSAIALYPNIATDRVTLRVPSDMISSVINIITLDGRIVYTSTVTAEETVISLSDIAKGIYWVSVGNKTEKLIKD